MIKKRDPHIYIIISILLILGLFFLGLSLGSIRLNFIEILKGIFSNTDKRLNFIIKSIRLPRLFNGLLVGASLAVSGMVFQRIINNPLASPDIIGIQSGASLVSVFLLISPLSASFLSLGALIGALLTASLVYSLSWRSGLYIPRLILIGIGVNALCAAVIQYLLMAGRIQDADKAYRWMSGSLYTSKSSDVWLLWPILIVSLVGCKLFLPRLQTMQLGDRSASLSGVNVPFSRLVLLALASLLSGAAVAVSGPIAFTALIIPHLSRMIYAKLDMKSFILTALMGSILVLAADLCAQHLFPNPLPVGLIISILGAPYFLVVLMKHNNSKGV